VDFYFSDQILKPGGLITAALGGEHEGGIRKLAAQLAQRADFVAG
jgi:hypothetical protein